MTIMLSGTSFNEQIAKCLIEFGVSNGIYDYRYLLQLFWWYDGLQYSYVEAASVEQIDLVNMTRDSSIILMSTNTIGHQQILTESATNINNALQKIIEG
jgi:hypothetical protein